MPRRLSPDSILRDGAFRRLVVAEGFAYTGEALLIVLFTLIALDAGPTGATIVLVAQGIPRALLLALGGLLSDRWGAARVALASAIARAALLVALGGLVLAAGVPSIAVLAGLGALLGVVDALAYPASFALVPAIVPAERLPAANSVIGGIEGLGDLAGPAAAAGLYALLGAGRRSPWSPRWPSSPRSGSSRSPATGWASRRSARRRPRRSSTASATRGPTSRCAGCCSGSSR
jgi:MFS family permease